MKTILIAILGACALVSGLPADVAAEPPVEGGRVLLLDNERMVEGIIIREGNRYRVRRELGESWIPADKVIRLCASRAEAYETLRSRTNLQDLDERLRLARWCQLHGLQEQGRAELKAALVLRPDCAEAKRILRCFDRDAEPAVPPTPVPVPAAPTPVKETPAAAPLPNAGLSMEAATLFSMRVQPILMNACASCHTSERGGSFRLMHTHGDSALNQRATQVNLIAAVAQVNRANAGISPLLLKAVSIHGDLAQPPLKGRQMPAFHTLEEWARQVAACMPETPVAAPPRPESIFSSRPRPEESGEAKPSDWGTQSPPIATKPVADVKPDTPPTEAKRTTGPAAIEPRDTPRTVCTTPPPKAPQEAEDEFDALHFNRQAHPERANEPQPGQP